MVLHLLSIFFNWVVVLWSYQLSKYITDSHSRALLIKCTVSQSPFGAQWFWCSEWHKFAIAWRFWLITTSIILESPLPLRRSIYAIISIFNSTFLPKCLANITVKWLLSLQRYRDKVQDQNEKRKSVMQSLTSEQCDILEKSRKELKDVKEVSHMRCRDV